MNALRGIKVIEFAGLAPGPFCGMVLSDYGARVIKIDKTLATPMRADGLARGKESVALNLKDKVGMAIARKLCASADVVIEPFRPGVMEKLGLGPAALLKENPRLVYARLTGYGQEGPLSKRAGHDINYLAISGMLSRFQRKGEKPLPPVNMMADFAGGGLMCAMGIVMALMQRSNTGQGQVLDANMVEGANYVGSFLWSSISMGIWGDKTGEGLLDSGSPWYGTYETSDGKYMAVGAIEPQFYAQLLEGFELDPEEYPQFGDWPKLSDAFTKLFLSRTQEEWCRVFDHRDACVTPVVHISEAHNYPHNKIRESFGQVSDLAMPRPAPKMQDNGPEIAGRSPPAQGQHTRRILQDLKYTTQDIDRMVDEGAVMEGATSKI